MDGTRKGNMRLDLLITGLLGLQLNFCTGI